MHLCPECNSPPQYTSFCTRCAQLFRPAHAKWDRLIRRWADKRANDRAAALTLRGAQKCGLTRREAAEVTGRSLSWIDDVKRRHGLPPFRPITRKGIAPRNGWTPAEDAILRAAIADGKTCAETRKLLARSLTAIQRRRATLRLPPFKRTHKIGSDFWSDQRLATLQQLLHEGLSYSEIGPVFGKNRNAIAGAVHKYLRKRRQHR